MAIINSLAIVGTGIIVGDGAGSFVGRTLTGTANQIAVTNGAGTAGAPTLTLPTDVVFPGTGAIKLPVGTTAQEPTAAKGLLRYNSTLDQYEGSTDGSTWTALGAGGGGGLTETDFFNYLWAYGA